MSFGIIATKFRLRNENKKLARDVSAIKVRTWDDALNDSTTKFKSRFPFHLSEISARSYLSSPNASFLIVSDFMSKRISRAKNQKCQLKNCEINLRNSGLLVMWLWLPEQKRKDFLAHKTLKAHSCLLRDHHHHHMCCFSFFDENKKKEEDNDARIVGKPSRIVTHSVHATMKRRFFFSLVPLVLFETYFFSLCCYFSLYLNNIEVFCKERREAQKRRSRRPRKKNEDGMVKWKWMGFMFPSCPLLLDSRFLFAPFRLTSRMSLRRHY